MPFPADDTESEEGPTASSTLSSLAEYITSSVASLWLEGHTTTSRIVLVCRCR